MASSRFLRAMAQSFATLALSLPASAEDRFAEAVAAVREARYAVAVESFRSLAEEGDNEAQYNLALLLEKGLGYPQNFSQALEWAILADLGGVSPAPDLVASLRELLPGDHYSGVTDRVAARLEARLEAGEQDAILQFARFSKDFRPEPDLEATLLWQTIGAALGVQGASAARDATASTLPPASLITVQQRATAIFMEEDLRKRFSEQPVSQHGD